MLVEQRKQVPMKVREHVMGWILFNRRYGSPFELCEEAKQSKVPSAIHSYPNDNNAGSCWAKSSLKRPGDASISEEEDSSKKIKRMQQTGAAADASRIIHFSSISRMSGEFDGHYKRLRQEEECLLKFVVSSLEKG